MGFVRNISMEAAENTIALSNSTFREYKKKNKNRENAKCFGPGCLGQQQKQQEHIFRLNVWIVFAEILWAKSIGNDQQT